MNHNFFTDAEQTALDKLVCETILDINSQIALTRRDPIIDNRLNDLLTIMNSIYAKLNTPLGNVFATEQQLRDMSTRDLRRRQNAVRSTTTSLGNLSQSIYTEMHQRWHTTAHGGECAICEDTSGKCAHRDLDYLAFVDAVDNPTRVEVAA